MSLHVRARLASLLGLRRRLVAGSVALLCAGSCLNPQPDPFPQRAGSSPAEGDSNASMDGVEQAQPGAATAAPPRPVNSGSEGTPAIMAAPPSAPPPAQPGGGQDAGAPPPVDGGAPDANPPANETSDGAL
ncbi:MAG: hypothetical protein ABI895_27305 [Deltaproteobacteria bacterium]